MIESAADFMSRKTSEWEADLADAKPNRTERRGGGQDVWLREAWTFLPQTNLPEKVLILERWRYLRTEGRKAFEEGAKPGDVEYRFGYYMLAATGEAAGRWLWGRFAMLIPAVDLPRLLEKARSEGTLRDS